MNFRVFFASTNATPEDYEFYKHLEVRCATVAQTTIVLSSADAKYFKEAANVMCRVLNPTLPDHVMQFFESRSAYVELLPLSFALCRIFLLIIREFANFILEARMCRKNELI
jgi:hypothetical protein